MTLHRRVSKYLFACKEGLLHWVSVHKHTENFNISLLRIHSIRSKTQFFFYNSEIMWGAIFNVHTVKWCKDDSQYNSQITILLEMEASDNNCVEWIAFLSTIICNLQLTSLWSYIQVIRLYDQDTLCSESKVGGYRKNILSNEFCWISLREKTQDSSHNRKNNVLDNSFVDNDSSC